MKKMKILTLSLACLLPLSVQAADICLEIQSLGAFLKFKKPALAKNGVAPAPAILIVPYGSDNAFVAAIPVGGMTMMDAKGNVRLWFNNLETMYFEGNDFRYSLAISAGIQTDKKFKEWTVDADYIYIELSVSHYVPEIDDWVGEDWYETDITLAPVSCKKVPQFQF